MSNCKFIGYLSFGYPNIEESLKRAEVYVNSGCDILEIDLPTNNPFLDSEFIGNRMKKAYENCSNYEKYFENIQILRNKYKSVGMLILAYEHTITEYGVDKFINKCKETGIEDIIFVGNKDEKTKNELIKKGLKISTYVQYHLDDLEVQNALNSNGFVYLQAKPGKKGFKENYETLNEVIKYLRKKGIKQSIYCGVGISEKEDFKMVNDAGADAAFVGSSLLKKETFEDIENMIKTWKNYIK